MPTWPASLPQDMEISNHSGTLPQMGIRSDVDAGPAFQRRRYTAAVQPFSGSITVTAAQYDTLYSFWVNDLAGGVLSFDWKNPRTDAAATVLWNCTSPPQVSAITGELYKVPIDIEVLP